MAEPIFPPLDSDALDLDPAVDRGPVGRHPYVRRLLREIAALRAANQRLLDLQREMIARDLVAARRLEPLNPVPRGTILTAPVGQPILIHIDNLRLLVNRVTGARDPVIRLLVGGVGATPQHCRELQLTGPSAVREHYGFALPGRTAAVVVLETYAPVEVLE